MKKTSKKVATAGLVVTVGVAGTTAASVVGSSAAGIMASTAGMAGVSLAATASGMAAIGSVVGGGMATGAVIVTVLPVALAAGAIYGVSVFLTKKNNIITQAKMLTIQDI